MIGLASCSPIRSLTPFRIRQPDQLGPRRPGCLTWQQQQHARASCQLRGNVGCSSQPVAQSIIMDRRA